MPRGPWCYWNEQKILPHPSINATIVTKVHLVSHDPIQPINSQPSRLLSNRIRPKILPKGQNSLSLPCAHKTGHGMLSLDPNSLSSNSGSGVSKEGPHRRSPLTFNFAFLFLNERQFSATTLHGRVKELWQDTKRCLNWYLNSKSHQLQRSVDFNRLDHKTRGDDCSYYQVSCSQLPQKSFLFFSFMAQAGCNSSLLNSVTERLMWNLSHGMTYNSALTALSKHAHITSWSGISGISCKMAFSL